MVSLEIHYDGSFRNEPIFHYVDDSVKLYENFDEDLLSYFMLCGVVKHTATKKVSKMYFKPHGKSLKNGRVLICSDVEVLEMLKDSKLGPLEVYTEHDGNDEVDNLHGETQTEIDNELIMNPKFSDEDGDSECESEAASLDNLTDNDEELIEVRKKKLEKQRRKKKKNENVDEAPIVNEAEHTQEFENVFEAENVLKNENALGIDNVIETQTTNGGGRTEKIRGIIDNGFYCGSDPDFNGYESEYMDSSDEDRIIEEDESDEDDPKINTVENEPYFDPNTPHKDIEFVKRMKFANCAELKHALKCYSVANGYKLKTVNSEQIRLLVKCFYHEKCEWRLYATPMSTEASFQIKSLCNVHTCIKEYDAKIIDSTWLAREYQKNLRDCPKWKLKEFQADVKEKYGLSVTLVQCYRAKKKALTEVEGALQEYYARLYDYAEEIERSNPGSKVIIDIKPYVQLRVFRRFYVIFQGIKRGWIENCRAVIGLDGCFLKGYCKGELLTAIGRDGNNQMFPIAWAIVELENKDSWSWFIRQLLRDLGVDGLQSSGAGWTIISDQQKQLKNYFLMPGIEILLYISMPIFEKTQWSKIEETILASIKMQHQRRIFEDNAKDPHLWSRAFFGTTTQCVNVENNTSETFNGFINEAREKPIINMLEDIRLALMIRVDKKLKELNKNPNDPICPRIKEKLEINKVNYRHWTCSHNYDHNFEVKMEKRETRRLPSRPQKQRRLEFHKQPRQSNQISRKGKEMKCSNCLQIGHNKLTCKNETVLKNVEPPKPRGRLKKPPVPTFFERPKNITRGSKKKKKRTDFGFGIYTDPITGDTHLNGFLIPNSGSRKTSSEGGTSARQAANGGGTNATHTNSGGGTSANTHESQSINLDAPRIQPCQTCASGSSQERMDWAMM